MEPFSLSQLFQGHDVTPVQALSKIVLAGARSVALATQMIAFVGDIRKHHPEVATNLEALSNAVLADWGLSANAKEPRPAPATAAAPPAKPPEELMWPPEPPVLAGVYTENFYHVREATKGRNDVLGAGALDQALDLEPNMKLRFTGMARWEEGAGWWLHVGLIGATALTTWVLHTNLKPGDEIPEDQR